MPDTGKNILTCPGFNCREPLVSFMQQVFDRDTNLVGFFIVYFCVNPLCSRYKVLTVSDEVKSGWQVQEEPMKQI